MSDTRPPDAFSAPSVEMICRVLGDAVLGSQIPNLVAALKVPERPDEERNTKWKRLFNAVAVAQNRQRDGRPLLKLVGEVVQPVRFSSSDEFEAHRAALNDARCHAQPECQRERSERVSAFAQEYVSTPALLSQPTYWLG